MSILHSYHIRCDAESCGNRVYIWAVDETDLRTELDTVGWRTYGPYHRCEVCGPSPDCIDGYLRNAALVGTSEGTKIIGELYGDSEKRIPDGTRIHTSLIKKRIRDDVYETANSIYEVQSWRNK